MASELTGSSESPFTIHQIIDRLSDLFKKLSVEAGIASTDDAETAAAINQEQEGSKNGDVGGTPGNSDESNRKGEDDASKKEKNGEDGGEKKIDENKREEVLHELDKSCKELKYMISSLEKLKTFETNLKDPLQTLHHNVEDILKDLGRVTVTEVPKQIPINLRVLRNNITRVKIQIPLQHHTANANSADKPWQTTIATRDADDLPHIYNESIFEESYFFKEIKDKYDELDIRERLCLLCFVIFPENAEIKKRLLRFWWVGENLVPTKDGKDEMQVVSETLETFVKNGFIQPVLKKNKLLPRSYKMTPIVRSCLIKFAKDARFFDYDSEGKPTMDFVDCKKACMVKSERPTDDWFAKYLQNSGAERLPADPVKQQKSEKLSVDPVKQQNSEKLSADLVKLQMLFNFPEEERLREASQRFDGLQTLFNVSKQFPALPKEWFSKMKGINVLYLGRWETTAGRPRHIEVEDIDFLRGLKNMKKLRLLSLQGISGIPRLPSSLCKLSNLRILDLRACHNLEKLPERIGALKKLTYLDLSECYLLDDLPKQIKQLEELQVLKGFVTGNGKHCCSFEDLAELKELRKLSVNVNSTEFDIEKAGIDISKFLNLKKLRIAWGSGGLTANNSIQDSSKPNEGERKTQGKEATKPKTQSKGIATTKPKSSDNGEPESIKGEQKGDDEKLKGGENGNARPIAAIRAVGFANKLKSLRRREKPKIPEGLEKLEKLDLQCFPQSTPPSWLEPEKMIGLKSLSLRGGGLGHLNPAQKGNKKWKVETLRLKYLTDFKMDWKDMQKQFPSLKYLEKVRCPRITFCPCDASGVWQKSSQLIN